MVARGQDESDRVLWQDWHRGALQGGPAACPGAHAAGAAAVPEDPGEGERSAGGARGEGEGGAAAGLSVHERSEAKAPARCPEDLVATLRGHRALRQLDLSTPVATTFECC